MPSGLYPNGGLGISLSSSEFVSGSAGQQPGYYGSFKKRTAEQDCQFEKCQQDRLLEQRHVDEPFLEQPVDCPDPRTKDQPLGQPGTAWDCRRELMKESTMQTAQRDEADDRYSDVPLRCDLEE